MHVREDSGAVEPETEIQIQEREHLRGRGAPIFIYAPFLTQPQAIKHSTFSGDIMDLIRNYKIHLLALIIVLVSEWIGILKFGLNSCSRGFSI